MRRTASGLHRDGAALEDRLEEARIARAPITRGPPGCTQTMSSSSDQTAISLSMSASLQRLVELRLDVVGRAASRCGLRTGAASRAAGLQRNTTVLWPFISTRCSTCQRTARASTRHSTSRPTAVDLVGRARMVHARHVLLDDRALVEIGRHVVRGGADQLDAARMGLRVRPRALEAGQEAVVDVDRAAGQLRAAARATGSACSAPAPPGRCARAPPAPAPAAPAPAWRPRRRRAPAAGGGTRCRSCATSSAMRAVVRHDGRHVDRELAAAHAEQQVVQAMAVLAHHQQHARRAGAAAWKCSAMSNCLRAWPNRASSVAASASCGGASKCTRMKKRPVASSSSHVAELLRVDDVAAGLVQQAGHRVHDAGGVAARQRENVFLMGALHGRAL